MFTPLTAKDVIFTIIQHEEHDSPEGHFDNAKQATYVVEQYNSGNTWAWCCVEVVCTPRADSLEGLKTSSYLGGCSYRDEEDFKTGGYYEDMQAETLAELNSKLEAVYSTLLGEGVN
jgi:hypothetical protein